MQFLGVSRVRETKYLKMKLQFVKYYVILVVLGKRPNKKGSHG